ncbi:MULTISPECIES: SDR family oxidoreductase [unclassified Streptomyces]|uniref:SDR family oxidoreductase n=1 Tax=unclassified Streptomyces TaxID=2593676 RepID=UPI001BEAD261|nr:MULTISPECIES: SDR family oxidoreductase [unclassified Streptomyces]MBT2458744.1 SDR family oxidoreductase [Streptomyces sp. ISL-86]
MNDSSKQPVVVSGVTKGLGRALIRRFAALGHPVAGCGRDAEALAGLETELEAELGEGRHRLDRVDVTDAGQVEAWAEAVRRELGAPGLVIANAGAINAPAPLWEVPPAEFDAVMRVNVGGVYAMARAFVPRIADGGTLVNISSGWGRNPRAMLATYTASKFAVEGLTRALAQEAAQLRPGVRVVALDPGGGINTDMLATCLPDEHDQYPTPDEWAGTAADYLLHRLPVERSEANLILS